MSAAPSARRMTRCEAVRYLDALAVANTSAEDYPREAVLRGLMGLAPLVRPQRGRQPYPLGTERWIDVEEAFLRTHYVMQGAQWCGKRLNRTPVAVASHANRMGITRRGAL